jgi:hypothetical protein
VRLTPEGGPDQEPSSADPPPAAGEATPSGS